LIINNWTDHALTENSGTITLVAGQKYDIRIEFYYNNGGAAMHLLWSSPSTSKMVVPQSQLFSTPAPPPPGCTYSISPSSRTIAATSGTGTVSVTAGAGCPWAAVSNASWITVTAGSSGTGNGSVSYSVTANTGPQRVGTMTIAGQIFTLTQSSGCVYSISPSSRTIASAGGTGTVSVTAGAGCPWTAVSNAAWITVTAGSSGSGNGSVSYSVAANTGPQRVGTITIAGKTFTLTQSSGCAYTISPASASFPRAGGAGTVNVTTAAGCTWTASKSGSWITLTSGTSGTGNGTVGYSVKVNNSGSSRSGTVTVNGQVHTVTQAAN